MINKEFIFIVFNGWVVPPEVSPYGGKMLTLVKLPAGRVSRSFSYEPIIWCNTQNLLHKRYSSKLLPSILSSYFSQLLLFNITFVGLNLLCLQHPLPSGLKWWFATTGPTYSGGRRHTCRITPTTFPCPY